MMAVSRGARLPPGNHSRARVPGPSHSLNQQPFGVLSRRYFLLHFFPTQPVPFQTRCFFQRCSLSRVCDERGQAAPLTGPRR